MRAFLSGTALALAAAVSLHAEVTIRVAGGRVDITASASPLAEVLERLARQTGMKVVYEGAAPRQLVSVSLLGRSPAEAVHDLLEGQGLNYALLGDSAGTGVQTLLMTGSPAPVVASSGPSAPPTTPIRPRSGPPPMSGPDVMDEPEEEEEVDEEVPAEAAPAPAEGASAPPQTAPAGGVPGLTLPNPFVPGGNNPPPAAAPAPGMPPVQTAPVVPGLQPSTLPGFVPVSPLSPAGPFAPVVPIGPTAPPASPAPEPPSREDPPS